MTGLRWWWVMVVYQHRQPYIHNNQQKKSINKLFETFHQTPKAQNIDIISIVLFQLLNYHIALIISLIYIHNKYNNLIYQQLQATSNIMRN